MSFDYAVENSLDIVSGLLNRVGTFGVGTFGVGTFENCVKAPGTACTVAQGGAV